MLSFENDYNRGAHPEILRRFVETNMDMEFMRDYYRMNYFQDCIQKDL